MLSYSRHWFTTYTNQHSCYSASSTLSAVPTELMAKNKNKKYSCLPFLLSVQLLPVQYLQIYNSSSWPPDKKLHYSRWPLSSPCQIPWPSLILIHDGGWTETDMTSYIRYTKTGLLLNHNSFWIISYAVNTSPMYLPLLLLVLLTTTTTTTTTTAQLTYP